MSSSYSCLATADPTCPETCVSLAACSDCDCVVLSDAVGGPWGDVMDVLFCIAPIVLLIVVTIKPNPMPTTQSLPLAAFLMYLVRLVYLSSDPVLTHGAIVLGLLEAWTPLSIMAGAITLFESMEASYCLPYMMREMKSLTDGHPIAEMMLIFCFAYMVEGASGFGTPVALGAPMLVSTGHPALESIVVLLIMNTFATVWGAVGTPIWFGLGSVGTPEDDFLEISQKAAIALGTSAFLLLPLVLGILVPLSMVRQNIVFVMASIATCIVPSVGIAFVSYEFPSLLGGIIGCAGTAVLIRFRVGLRSVEEEHKKGDIGSVSENSIARKYHRAVSGASVISDEDETDKTNGVVVKPVVETDKAATDEEEAPVSERRVYWDKDLHDIVIVDDDTKEEEFPSLRDTVDEHLGPRKAFGEGYLKELVGRTFPIWGVVLILILTRVEQIGIKELLTKREPSFAIHLGTLGTFRLSASIVFQLRDIMTYPNLSWKYELLYVPFLIPFVLVSAITMFIYRKDLSCRPRDIANTVASRLANPAIALLGALTLVQLMIRVGDEAPATILGTILSDWFKQGFIVISPLLGALGSFFSGSTTVSNLTFGSIQTIAAESIGTSVTAMLALQSVGASAGNGICLNNIIAACAVVGLNVGEGQILLRTYKYVFANTTIATIVMLAIFFRF